MAKHLTYRQVADSLAMKIRRGQLKEGRLLAAKVLMDEYGVPISVINRAFEILRARNLTRAVTGQGTFVSYQKPQDKETDEEDSSS